MDLMKMKKCLHVLTIKGIINKKGGYKMDLRQLLKGKNKAAQARLEAVFNSIGNNPKISWYPSAGNDYRDILELTDVEVDETIRGRINIAKDYGITDKPVLFIHTDYSKKMVEIKKGKIFDDNRTKVIVEEIYKLSINDSDVNYFVNPEFVSFPQDAPKKPEIYLLDLEITSNKLGTIKKPLIYFLFENINFLQEVLLKHRINISHIVKVREGCGFGGNKKSITLAFAFFSVLNTKYLITDYEVHFYPWEDAELIEEIAENSCLNLKTDLKDYELEELRPIRQITNPIIWSDRHVKIYKVTNKEKPLTLSRIKEILKPIEQLWANYTKI